MTGDLIIFFSRTSTYLL